MLGQLARWDSYRRFHREIGQLIRSQEALNQRTMELGRRTLAKELRDLLPQERADLKVAAREQTELARLFDRLLQGMGETADQLRQTDPSAAATIADAFAQATKLALGATMRAAGDGVEQNRIGQAVAQQKQVVENLQEILDILANRRDSEWSLTKNFAAQRRKQDLDGTRQLDRSRDGKTLSGPRPPVFRPCPRTEGNQTEAQDLAARHASAESSNGAWHGGQRDGQGRALLERRQTGGHQETEQTPWPAGPVARRFEQDPPRKPRQTPTPAVARQQTPGIATPGDPQRSPTQTPPRAPGRLERRTRELDKLASEAKSPDPMLQRQGAAAEEEQGRLAVSYASSNANDPEADPPSDGGLP